MNSEFTAERVENYHQSTLGHIDAIDRLLANGFFNGATAILDVGCGDGKITARIAQQYPSIPIVGCDVSSEMIAFASKKYAKEQFPNLQFIKKSGAYLGFNKEFSHVISFNCLHWIKDQKQVFQEIYRSLLDAGKAVVIACPRSNEDEMQQICKKVVLSWKWLFSFLNFKSEHSFHSESEYMQILQEIGFCINKIDQETESVIFQNRKLFEKFLTSILTPLYHLPDGKRAAFLQDILSAMEKRGNIDAEERVHLQVAQITLAISKPLEK